MLIRFLFIFSAAVIMSHKSQADTVVLIDTKTLNQNANAPSTDQLSSSQSVRDPNLRTFLDADEIQYDQNNHTIIAKGSVEITRGSVTLNADEVRFNQTTNQILAVGNVKLKDKDNNLLFADFFNLKGDLKTGAGEAVRGIMADDAIFAANRIKRLSENESQFDQVIYTPCKLCRKNPKDEPTWSIQSRHMLLDEKGDIEHTDSILKLRGTPVAYLPYLSHPGPNVKRRSGFLTPFFGASGNLGAIFGLSYYWAINDQSDLTITPIYTRENPLGILHYRHKFCSGYLDIEMSGTKSRFEEGPAANPVQKNGFRGHIRAKGLFEVDAPFFDETFFGFDINRTLDDTYLKKYVLLDLSRESYLTSRVYGEGFKDRSYVLVESFVFQGLQRDDDGGRIPYIVPSVEYNYLSQPLAYQLTPYFDASFLNLQRRRGQNVDRVRFLAGVKRQWISTWGTITDLGVEANFDHYNVSTPVVPAQDGEHARIVPRVYAHMRYPLYTQFTSGRMVLEPILGAVITANNQNGAPFPNEDSFVELNDANIFDADRFSGHDFIDHFSRVNYGLKLAFYSKSLGNSSFFIGQSVSLGNVTANGILELSNTGVRQGTSDFVTRIQYTYQDWLNLVSRAVIDRNTFNSKRNESLMYVGKPEFRVKLGYNKFPRPGAMVSPVEQLCYGFSSQINPKWRIEADFSRELGSIANSGALSHSGSLIYSDDCFEFSTSLTKTFYEDRDFKPGTTVMFRISFKNLGDVSFNANRVGLGQSLRD